MSTGLSPGADEIFDGRLRWLALAVVCTFGLFVLRLFQLQIVESEALARRSLSNAVRHVRLEPPRGRLLRCGDRLAAV